MNPFWRAYFSIGWLHHQLETYVVHLIRKNFPLWLFDSHMDFFTLPRYHHLDSEMEVCPGVAEDEIKKFQTSSTPPGRLTFWTQKSVVCRCFSHYKGVFWGSMLVFGGVVETSKTFLEDVPLEEMMQLKLTYTNIFLDKKTPKKKEGLETVSRYLWWKKTEKKKTLFRKIGCRLLKLRFPHSNHLESGPVISLKAWPYRGLCFVGWFLIRFTTILHHIKLLFLRLPP